MKVRVTVIAVVMMVTAGSSLAADWPQWQGPNRDGKSADTGLLKQWPKRVHRWPGEIDKLGGGDSAPAIAAGRIFGHEQSRRQGSRLGPVREGRK